MDAPFTFDRFITGKYFIGHKAECQALANIIATGDNAVIYEPPKSGKMSLIQQTFINMKMSGRNFSPVIVDAFNVRSIEMFLQKFGGEILKALYKTPEEYDDAVKTYLRGTHFIFDKERYSSVGEIISMNWDTDMDDARAILRMPALLSRDREETIVLIIKNFDNLLKFDGYDSLFRTMKGVLAERSLSPFNASWIITGSRVNAMKDIFRHKPYFSGVVTHLPMMPIEDSLIVEYIRAGFNMSGKVIERNVAMGPGKLFEGNMWYINHFLYICDSLTKGFVNDRILMDALGKMIAIHGPRFKTTMDNLTAHQVNFLMAVCDDETRFSSSEVIRKYCLNSSANVIRVKDALMKKEVITTGEKDEIIILDPLFKHWLKNYYFV